MSDPDLCERIRIRISRIVDRFGRLSEGNGPGWVPATGDLLEVAWHERDEFGNPIDDIIMTPCIFLGIGLEPGTTWRDRAYGIMLLTRAGIKCLQMYRAEPKRVLLEFERCQDIKP